MGKQKAEDRYRARTGDIVVVLLVVCASAASIVYLAGARAGERGITAVIEVNGREVRRVGLTENGPGRRFTVKGAFGPSVVEVDGDRVRMVESTCRDKICVGRGWAMNRGDGIVCLPNRVVISITGRRRSGTVDTVTE